MYVFTLLQSLPYLSDNEAKHLSAPSATWLSSCRKRVDKDCTHDGNVASAGSILVHRRDTTVIAECNVSLCTRTPWSRMNDNTQARPPASNTAPASREHISSNTYRMACLIL